MNAPITLQLPGGFEWIIVLICVGLGLVLFLAVVLAWYVARLRGKRGNP